MGRHNFKKMKIWEEGMGLVKETYKIIKKFPEVERFNLVTQMTRCAVSIPSNIAEGTSKRTNKHLLQYLDNSLGSAFEWETQLLIAYDQKYIAENDFEDLEQKIQKLQKMISAFIDNLERES